MIQLQTSPIKWENWREHNNQGSLRQFTERMCALGQHHHSASADLSNWPPAGKSLDPTYLVPRVHVRSSPPEVLPSSSPLSSCVCWSSPFDPVTRFCLSPLLPANSKILETQLVKHLGDEVIVLKIRWSGFFFFFFFTFWRKQPTLLKSTLCAYNPSQHDYKEIKQ